MTEPDEIQERRLEEEGDPQFTIREVARLVAFLPAQARAELAKGPKPDGCRVCRVLSEYRGSGAAWALHYWHSTDATGERAASEEQWERCEAIYRVCGWAG